MLTLPTFSFIIASVLFVSFRSVLLKFEKQWSLLRGQSVTSNGFYYLFRSKSCIEKLSSPKGSRYRLFSIKKSKNKLLELT